MSEGYWIALAGIVVSGAAISAQAPINARLGGGLNDTMTAAMVSFGVGFTLLLLVVLLRGAWPGGDAVRSVPWWAWGGGVLGAYYVWVAAHSVSKLGVLTLTAALIAGQIIGSLVLDAYGAFGLPVREFAWHRLVAAGLVAAGVVLSMQG